MHIQKYIISHVCHVNIIKKQHRTSHVYHVKHKINTSRTSHIYYVNITNITHNITCVLSKHHEIHLRTSHVYHMNIRKNTSRTSHIYYTNITKYNTEHHMYIPCERHKIRHRTS